MTEVRHFEIQRTDGVCVLHLNDFRKYRALVLYELEDELLQLVNEQQPKRVLVNFAVVSLCPTACINALLRAKSRMLSYGGRMKLCGMNEIVRSEFQMLNLDGTVFEIYEHAADALRDFQQQPEGA